MPKIKVEDLKCFDNVSWALGETQARCELFKALNYKFFKFYDIQTDDIAESFSWSLTPQGHGFWNEVYKKIEGIA